MENLNKKQIEDMFPHVTIEDSDIGTYIIVHKKVSQPARFAYFMQAKNKTKAIELATFKDLNGKNQMKPIIQVIAG